MRLATSEIFDEAELHTKKTQNISTSLKTEREPIVPKFLVKFSLKKFNRFCDELCSD